MPMIARFRAQPPARTPLLITFAFDGQTPNAGSATSAVAAAEKTGDLATEFRKVSTFHQRDGAIARFAFVGLGARKDLDAERLRRGAALAQAHAEALRVDSFVLFVEPAIGEALGAERAAAVVAEGLVLGSYRYEPPRKAAPKPRHAQKADVVAEGVDAKEFTRGFARGIAAAEATNHARWLEDQPGNLMTPTRLAQEAKRLAGNGIKVSVLDEPEMRRLKMGALLGVSRGSSEAAKLIVLEHGPANAKHTVCIVGKGLTFDTGGISIKPASKMDEMRYDMCGGGAVLGLFDAIRRGALGTGKRKTRVIGIVAAVENMPDGAAQKPGDVVTAMDGTTIEVLNTDAEGRLVLADALCYAKSKWKPAAIVDLATLTGAVVVALGHEAAGIMGNDAALIGELVAAGKAADEPLWELPLWEPHREQMKSKFADLQNLNSPAEGNGAIAGGAFLSFFVEGTAWAHLDIAGTAWGGRNKDYYRTGAAGTAVRTLLEWVRARG